MSVELVCCRVYQISERYPDQFFLIEMIVYGNIVYTIGSILVAAAATVRSFDFMIGGRIILALGDIATQIAQYKMFSSWFPPSNGFASTLGFELAIGKIGGFIGKSTSNIIASVIAFRASTWLNQC
ncbi:MAG: hypothetical protein LBE67_14645 [Kocuria palustris]|nr:hypothetical protein [Kocuria palustris]